MDLTNNGLIETETDPELYNSVIDSIKNVLLGKVYGEIDGNELMKLMKYAKRNAREFYKKFMGLYKYADNEIILNTLWEIRVKNKKSFKDINNAFIFWVLENNHPIKPDMSSSLTIGNNYLSSEILEIQKPIVEYHLHKIIKPRVSVSLLQSFYKSKRIKESFENPNNQVKPLVINKHKLSGDNPMDFTQHKMKI